MFCSISWARETKERLTTPAKHREFVKGTCIRGVPCAVARCRGAWQALRSDVARAKVGGGTGRALSRTWERRCLPRSPGEGQGLFQHPHARGLVRGVGVRGVVSEGI